MSHIATAISLIAVFVLVALVAAKFVAFGDAKPMSPEELDRSQLDAFYREILFLLLGLVLGASLFCLFAGYAVASQLSN